VLLSIPLAFIYLKKNKNNVCRCALMTGFLTACSEFRTFHFFQSWYFILRNYAKNGNNAMDVIKMKVFSINNKQKKTSNWIYLTSSCLHEYVIHTIINYACVCCVSHTTGRATMSRQAEWTIWCCCRRSPSPALWRTWRRDSWMTSYMYPLKHALGHWVHKISHRVCQNI